MDDQSLYYLLEVKLPMPKCHWCIQPASEIWCCQDWGMGQNTFNSQESNLILVKTMETLFACAVDLSVVQQ